ncbi:MAG: cadherin-like domain-containing protein [Verrucomicrobiae bacterium]|nr:cadherin-like domain-containing protein [Verrucomicrobiae bacterium]
MPSIPFDLMTPPDPEKRAPTGLLLFAIAFLLAMSQATPAAAATLYFTQASGTASLDALKSANLDGSSLTTLASDSGNFIQPRGLAIDAANGHVYVADASVTGAGIVRYNLDGSGRTVIVAPTATALYNGVTVGGGKLYFTQGSGTSSLDALKSANLDGSGIVTLASDSGNFTQPNGIALDLANSHLYLADTLGILRYNLDGTGRTVVIAPTASATYSDVAVAGGKLYFTQGSGTSSLDALKSANLDGSSIVTLASDAAHFAQPSGVTVDTVNNHLYVADGSPPTAGQGLLRYNLDGTGRTQIVAPVTSATFQMVAIYRPPPPNPPSTPDLAAASDTGASSTDNITADNTPTFIGTGPAGATITVSSSVHGTVGSGPADGSGNWSVTTSTLSDGTHLITATATTGAGTSVPSDALFVTIDTLPPTVLIGAPSLSQTTAGGGPVTYTISYGGAHSVSLATGNITLNTTGSAAATTVEVTGSGAAARTVTLSGLSGVGTLGLSLAAGTATDLAGNSAPAAGPGDTFHLLGLDFGDAPTAAQSGFASSYPVLLAHDGARHRIPPGGATLHLGTVPLDAEPDGQPDATATGDDLADTADEDGVSLPVSFPGGLAVNLTVTVTGSGTLNAWIDWNRDGDWNDAGEQVFTDLALSEAGNPHVLAVSVPSGVVSGVTFARFRFSSVAGLSPLGEASDGEVEDYALTLLANGVPTAGTDTLQTDEGAPSAVFVAKLLVNDTDPDGDALSITAVDATSTAGGTVALSDGVVTYTPPADFSGDDSFTYLLSDGRGETAVGTVLVNVRDAEAAGDNPARVVPTEDGFLIRFAGIPGVAYQVQWSDNVNGPWLPLGDPATADAQGRIEVEDTTAPQPNLRFYRIIPLPGAPS